MIEAVLLELDASPDPNAPPSPTFEQRVSLFFSSEPGRSLLNSASSTEPPSAAVRCMFSARFFRSPAWLTNNRRATLFAALGEEGNFNPYALTHGLSELDRQQETTGTSSSPHCPALCPLLAGPPQQQQQPLRPGDGESTNATAGEYAEEVEKEEAPNDCELSHGCRDPLCVLRHSHSTPPH